MADIQRMPVVSSNVSSVGYDPDTQTLEVEFNTGSVYSYEGVPQAEYDNLLSAQSVGSYFARNIRNVYRARQS